MVRCQRSEFQRIVGELQIPKPVLLIVAVSSRYESALSWSNQNLPAEFGPVLLHSPAFPFRETEYYKATMGTELMKQFLAFERFVDPASLPAIKRRTNELEESYRLQSVHPEPRPLNLDPGYISEAKLVLASTKDHAHRVYLGDGIFAEVTLHLHQKHWQAWPWTYPDYRRADYQEFFSECRRQLRAKMRFNP
jgi:hypothetical protein